MKLRNRLALVTIGVIVFLIITPFLVLYARGFKYDFNTGKIVKTGAIVIRTEPNEADIFLNNQKQKAQSPKTLRFILPGDYDIRIEKNNYQSWSKRLTVRSQLVTWVNTNRESITLFLTEPKLIRLLPTDSRDLPKQDKTLASQISFTNNEIHFSDSNGESYLILRSISPITNAKLNLHTGYLLFQNESKIKAIELDGRGRRNIFTLVDAGKDFVVDDKGERLYVISETEIREYQIR